MSCGQGHAGRCPQCSPGSLSKAENAYIASGKHLLNSLSGFYCDGNKCRKRLEYSECGNYYIIAAYNSGAGSYRPMIFCSGACFVDGIAVLREAKWQMIYDSRLRPRGAHPLRREWYRTGKRADPGRRARRGKAPDEARNLVEELSKQRRRGGR